MDNLRHDLQYAIRSLRGDPGFVTLTTITLALGTGMITALFAVVQAVLLHPITTDQERVVRIWTDDVERGFARSPVSYTEFEGWRARARSFESIAVIQQADASTVPVNVDGRPTAIELTPVSAGFFDTLHQGTPLQGRSFEASDEYPGAELVAVVSARFWRRAGGGDPSFVGRRLTWAGSDRTIRVIGVAPPDFDYPIGTDVWVPIARFFDGIDGRFDYRNRNFAHFEVIGRLAHGIEIERAQAELTLVRNQLIDQFPGDYQRRAVVVEPLLDTLVGNSRQVLWFLFAAAGLVFMIAGVNVAALVLMRASARRKEIATRVALGASHVRLTRQTVTEALLLGALGALAGLAVAQSCLTILEWLGLEDVPRIEHATMDVRVFLFCIGATIAWVLALGTVPIWGHRRLAASGMASLELSPRALQATHGLKLFAVAQIAAAVVVAVGAGLLMRSLSNLQRIDRGFAADDLTVIALLLPQTSRTGPSREALAVYEQMLPNITAIPGVISATPVHLRPGSGMIGLSAAMTFQGQTEAEAANNPWATWEPVLPSYFATMGVSIVRGRGFTEADTADTSPVAVVSESVARRYWPGEDPIGKQLRFIPRFPWVTVVGVAREQRYRELTRTWLTVYFPASQFFFFSPTTLVVRSAQGATGVIPAVRDTIRSTAPDAAIESIESMNDLLGRELSRPRAAVAVTGLFAFIAVVLSGVGVYGVMAYDVRQRQRELAVRSAVGASPGCIFRTVFRRSVILGSAGAIAGLTGAFLVVGTLRALLYEIEPTDAMSFAVAGTALLIIVMLASYAPARRAASADPAATLRL